MLAGGFFNRLSRLNLEPQFRVRYHAPHGQVAHH
jgi:hypothetical protein